MLFRVVLALVVTVAPVLAHDVVVDRNSYLREEPNSTSEIILTLQPGDEVRLLEVGKQSGYVTEDQFPSIVRKINASGATILFLALGSPRQELWMAKYLPDLNVKLCQGVGGTFDVIAGRVKRAPPLFRRLNLEWLYRLIRQPSRIRRQMVFVIFIVKVVLRKLNVLVDE